MYTDVNDNFLHECGGILCHYYNTRTTTITKIGIYNCSDKVFYCDINLQLLTFMHHSPCPNHLILPLRIQFLIVSPILSLPSSYYRRKQHSWHMSGNFYLLCTRPQSMAIYLNWLVSRKFADWVSLNPLKGNCIMMYAKKLYSWKSLCTSQLEYKTKEKNIAWLFWYEVLKIMYEIFQIVLFFEKKDVPNTLAIFTCSLQSLAEFLNAVSFLSVHIN